jgi:hypothetical protein
MKKSNIALTLALSAILLAFLSSSLTPVLATDPKSWCVCNHYDEREVNTQWDEVTGTGVTGYYSGNTFWMIYYILYRGLGGFYQPPSPPNIAAMNVHYKWTDSYGNHNTDTTYNYPTPTWTYPYDPFGQGFSYHVQIDYVYAWPSGGTYAEGSSSSWFQWPPYPYTYWYDQGSLAAVSS